MTSAWPEWKDHVDETVKKISKAIGALKRVRPFISVKTALQIYHALIRPYFDYCSSDWGECSVTLCDKLQKLQNRAARVITRSGYDVSAKHLISLRKDNLTKRRKKVKATLMFKMLNGLAPDYLQDLFAIRTTKYKVRNLEMKLNLPNWNQIQTISKEVLSTVWPHYGTTYPLLKEKWIDFMKLRVRLPHGNLVKQYFCYYSRYRISLYYCYCIFTEGFTVFN